MFDPSHLYPQFVSDLISDLREQECADSTLKSYSNYTSSDPILHKIYMNLKYPVEKNIPSKLVISILNQEYMSDFPPIDSDFETYKWHKLEDYEMENIDESEGFENYPRKNSAEIKGFGLEGIEETNIFWDKISKKNGEAHENNRAKNGLKSLSLKVKEIVEKIGPTTYQAVANCLISESKDLGFEEKDEKNIRRRVYDALNVLVAVGTLKRDSKNVEIVPTTEKTLEEKVKITSQKLKNLKSLSEQVVLLKGLIQRNKNLVQKKSGLFLPFQIVAVPKMNHHHFKVLTNSHRNSLKVKASQRIQILSGEEILKHLEITCDFGIIPSEVNSLCSLFPN